MQSTVSIATFCPPVVPWTGSLQVANGAYPPRMRIIIPPATAMIRSLGQFQAYKRVWQKTGWITIYYPTTEASPLIVYPCADTPRCVARTGRDRWGKIRCPSSRISRSAKLMRRTEMMEVTSVSTHGYGRRVLPSTPHNHSGPGCFLYDAGLSTHQQTC